MQIQVRALRESLELLKPVVPRKPTLTVLGNVLLQDGTLRATDLEAGVAITLGKSSGFTCYGEGEGCLLPFQKISELLKRIPGQQTLTLSQQEREVKLSWPDGQATFDTEAKPEDFPPFPKVEASAATSTVDGDVLVPALSAVLDYVAADGSRPVLNGVFLLLGERLDLAAADGFRLASKTLPIGLQAEGMETVIVPAQTVRILEHLGRKAPRDVPPVGTLAQLVTAKRQLEIAMDKTLLSIHFGHITVVTHLVQGNPPDYRSLIPKEFGAEVMVMAPELDRAVRSVLGIAKETAGIVRLSWTEESMTVQSGTEDSVQVTVPVQSITPGRVAMNIGYLLQYLQGKSSVVKIALANAAAGPVTLTYGDAPLVLVMPMQVQWDDEPAGETSDVTTPVANEGEVSSAETVAQVVDEIDAEIKSKSETKSKNASVKPSSRAKKASKPKRSAPRLKRSRSITGRSG